MLVELQYDGGLRMCVYVCGTASTNGRLFLKCAQPKAQLSQLACESLMYNVD